MKASWTNKSFGFDCVVNVKKYHIENFGSIREKYINAMPKNAMETQAVKRMEISKKKNTNKSIQRLCCRAQFSVWFEREWAINRRHIIELNCKYRRQRYRESSTIISTQCGRDAHLSTKCLTNRFIYPSNEWQITRQSLMIELVNKIHAHCSVRSRCCVLIRDLFIYFFEYLFSYFVRMTNLAIIFIVRFDNVLR